MLDNELNMGRPINYVGSDLAWGEGHSWVCDGYDASNFFHMNWGWGGYDNGYFSINNLQTTNGNFNPSDQHEAIIGIQPPPPPTNSLDAGVFSIAAPSNITCNPVIFTPQVIIRNFGSDTLKSCAVVYNLDGVNSQTYNWTGSLLFYQSALITLPTMTVSAGSHLFISTTRMPNGFTDQNPSNDTLQTSINVMSNTTSQQAPYVQGFESTGFPYNDCFITSFSGPQWQRVTTASYSGVASMGLDNYIATMGDTDSFITPSIDMSTITNPTLTFELAYAQLDSSDTNDQLNILASTNCGNSWTQLNYSKTGDSLATTGIVSSTFTPVSQSQWRKETVNLVSLTGQTDVRFKFQFTTYPAFQGTNIFNRGNNIYIDDINITTNSAGIAEEYKNEFNLDVFPNPLIDHSTLSFNILEKNVVSISIYDIVGREIFPVSEKTELNAGTYTLPINRNGLKSGIYFVKLNVNDYSVTKKIIIQ